MLYEASAFLQRREVSSCSEQGLLKCFSEIIQEDKNEQYYLYQGFIQGMRSAGLVLAGFLLNCRFWLRGHKDLQRKEQLKTQ